MKILPRYIVAEMVGPTLLGFLFYTSVVLMRSLFEFAGMIIRRSLGGATVGKLLALSLPHIVVLTLPMALLLGVLIAVGRLSADSELTAMRALGMSTKRIYLPVLVFSILIALVNLYLISEVMPRGNSQLQALKAEIFASAVEKQLKPRVFYDDYENLMIYVNDVDPRTGRWKGVFVADTRTGDLSGVTTPADVAAMAEAQRQNASPAAGVLEGRGQRIVIADSGVLAITPTTKQIWLNLTTAETHLWNPAKPFTYDVNRNVQQRILLPDKFSGDLWLPSHTVRSLREMNLRELFAVRAALRDGTDEAGQRMIDIEIHKKFAYPGACIVFGLLALPLGMTNRRGGKSSGFALSIAVIAFYYVVNNNGTALAMSGKVHPAVGLWAANLILLVLGLILLARANDAAGGGETLWERTLTVVRAVAQWSRRRLGGGKPARRPMARPRRDAHRLNVAFPNILDRYVVREFGKILALVVVSAVVVVIIIDFSEIANDIRSNNVPLQTVVTYYRFLLFQILHWTLPMSVLVATLVTFGILARNNEVTALKASGVSLYRIALPVVAVAAVVSLLSYFILDFIMPYSNQRVAQLATRIKGSKPFAVAMSDQQKLWLLGRGQYLINFLAYDRKARELTQVQVFEIHPRGYRLARRVYAQRARWNGDAWVFERGWIRSFTDDGKSTFTPITQPVALFYSETPEDFGTEARPPDQMTYAQLRRYISAIRQSGYATDELTVKLHGKAAWPMISLVMALIALPFAFRIGKKGALAGAVVALVVGIVYWGMFAVFTKFGEAGNLPPLLSAWSANILFALAALHLFLRVET